MRLVLARTVGSENARRTRGDQPGVGCHLELVLAHELDPAVGAIGERAGRGVEARLVLAQQPPVALELLQAHRVHTGRRCVHHPRNARSHARLQHVLVNGEVGEHGRGESLDEATPPVDRRQMEEHIAAANRAVCDGAVGQVTLNHTNHPRPLVLGEIGVRAAREVVDDDDLTARRGQAVDERGADEARAARDHAREALECSEDARAGWLCHGCAPAARRALGWARSKSSRR